MVRFSTCGFEWLVSGRQEVLLLVVAGKSFVVLGSSVSSS